MYDRARAHATITMYIFCGGHHRSRTVYIRKRCNRRTAPLDIRHQKPATKDGDVRTNEQMGVFESPSEFAEHHSGLFFVCLLFAAQMKVGRLRGGTRNYMLFACAAAALKESTVSQ
jgi:hypothetical protein